MSAPSLREVMAAVASLTGEVRLMRTELDTLRAEVAALQVRRDAPPITPETLVMLAAVVTSYLGKRVRIRSARVVPPGADDAGAWARHGRAAIQTSHRLQRGH